MLLRNIKLFVEVSKSKSISEAAKRLYISQQTLSSAIRNLEEELGISLFSRSSSGVMITEEGSDFLSDAIKILSILNYWTNRTTLSRSHLEGTVDVAGGEPFGTLMVQLVSQLRKSHPNITVNFHAVPSHELPDFLRSKGAKIGMAASSSLYSVKDLHQFAIEKDFVMEQIGLTRLVMIINSDNIICKEKSVSLRDCKHLNLAVRNDEHPLSYMDIKRYFQKVYSFNGIRNVIRFVDTNKDVAAFVPVIIYKEDIQPIYENIAHIKLTDYGTTHPLFLFHPRLEHSTPEELIVLDLIRKLELTRSYKETDEFSP